MRRAYLPLLMLIWVASRCSHTHSVSRDEGTTDPRASAEESSHTEKPSHEKRDKQDARAKDDSHAKRHAQAGHAKVTDEKAPASSPPLSVSPAGLLSQGGAASIQDRLIARGYLHRNTRTDELDGPTEKALREFQHDNGLPATGMPDDLTVNKLGLSPKDLFRASPPDGDKR